LLSQREREEQKTLSQREREKKGPYLHEFFSGRWYIVHGWFLWMLLLFEACIVSFRVLFGQTYARMGRIVQRMAVEKPVLIYAALLAISYVGSTVGAALIDPKFVVHWEVLSGPFYFVEMGYLVDFAFFLLGVMLGQAYGTERFRSIEEALFTSPILWVSASCVILVVAVLWPVSGTPSFCTLWRDPALRLNIITTPALAVSLSFAVLSVFRTYGDFRSALLQSLSGASYTIYIFHLILCIWTEYLLLSVMISVYAKLAISYATAVLASWGLHGIKVRITARVRLIAGQGTM
jgi:hypothetical protein